MTSTLNSINLTFATSPAMSLGPDDVLAFDGHEQLTRPYHMRIVFQSDHLTDPASLLRLACTFSFSLGQAPNQSTRVFNSIVLAAGRLDAMTLKRRFFVEIGPLVALRGLNRRCLVNATLNQSLERLLSDKLGTDNQHYDYDSDKTSIPNIYAVSRTLNLEGDDVTGSMIVQYQETDLDYINRLCESAGVFYYFVNAPSATTAPRPSHPEHHPTHFVEKIKFIDLQSTQDILDYTYTTTPPEAPDPNWVWSFTSRSQLIPRSYAVRGVLDNQSTFASVGYSVSSASEGTIVEDIATTCLIPDLNTLSALRLAEITTRQTVYSGHSSGILLAAGARFKLKGDQSNGQTVYLVESISHSYSTPQYNVGGGQTIGYSNAFVCLDATGNYTPPRLMKKPVMAGVYYAQVQASTSTLTRALLSGTGRYRILLRFDEAPGYEDSSGLLTAGTHSALIRLATPYGGPNGVGQHFPLIEGTEVLVAFVNGDPDRPVIIDTVATKENPSPVIDTNSTRNRIVSLSGVMIEMDDGV